MTKLSILGLILSPLSAVIGALGIATNHPENLFLGISLVLLSQAIYWLKV
jgi:Mg2+ and Co2+ transporter CorA